MKKSLEFWAIVMMALVVAANEVAPELGAPAALIAPVAAAFLCIVGYKALGAGNLAMAAPAFAVSFAVAAVAFGGLIYVVLAAVAVAYPATLLVKRVAGDQQEPLWHIVVLLAVAGTGAAGGIAVSPGMAVMAGGYLVLVTVRGSSTSKPRLP